MLPKTGPMKVKFYLEPTARSDLENIDLCMGKSEKKDTLETIADSDLKVGGMRLITRSCMRNISAILESM